MMIRFRNQVEKTLRFRKDGFTTTPLRSKIMSKIKGKNTRPELLLRKALWRNKLRYRTHNPKITGQPDISIIKYRLVIFIDGDFWHGYNWKIKKHKIMTNQNFWITKIERNIKRDLEVNRLLMDKGFTVMRFWEHEVKQNLDRCINQVMLYVESARTVIVPETM